jgi:hypothetical protein
MREPADLPDELVDRISNAVIAKLTSQGLREPAFQAVCRGFEPLLPLHCFSFRPFRKSLQCSPMHMQSYFSSCKEIAFNSLDYGINFV